MTKITNDWKCGLEQGQRLTVEELAYVVDKSFYGLGDTNHKVIAVAIAMAESQGYTGAVGDCDIGYSLGLWQIHVPAHRATVQLGGDVFNAYDNAAMAATVYESGGFKNWSTYKDGTYKQYLTQAQTAWPNKRKPGTVPTTVNSNPGGSALPGKAGDAVDKASDVVSGTVDATKSVGSALSDLAGYAGKTASWLSNPHNWLRIAYVTLGAGVVIAGLAKLIGADDAFGVHKAVLGKVTPSLPSKSETSKAFNEPKYPDAATDSPAKKLNDHKASGTRKKASDVLGG